MDPDAKMIMVVPNVTLVTQMYDNMLEYYYGENNLQDKSNYKIEVEMIDGSIKTFNPNEIITTINRGSVLAKDLNENDEI